MPFNRVLIIRPSALGDVCRSVPVLVSLRKALPDARIDWLVQSEFLDAVRAHPDLTTAIPFDRRRMSLGALHRKAPRAALTDLLRTLRAPRYDLVLDCQGLARSGFLARATGARTRVGHADARELAWAHYTERVLKGRSDHTVDRMLDLVRALRIEPVADMRLYAPEDTREGLPAGLAPSRPIVIAPTSRWPGKRWPVDRFTELTRWLLRETDQTIAIVGAGSEREQCAALLDAFANEPRVTDLLGKTSVGALMHLISDSSMVIANDSAALHMAVGYDKPIVALFGPTDISRVGPYQRDACVLQHASPEPGVSHKDEEAGLRLMQRISIEEVRQRVAGLLRSQSETAPPLAGYHR